MVERWFPKPEAEVRFLLLPLGLLFLIIAKCSMVKEIFLESIKAKDKFVQFKAMIPAGEAKPVAPLGPLLGQYGVNLVEFCSDFNKRTEFYSPGIMIPVLIRKMLKERAYEMELKPPNLPFLIFCAINENIAKLSPVTEGDEYTLTLTEIDVIDKLLLFDIIRLSDSLQGRGDIEKSAKIVFGFLTSTGIELIEE